MFAFFPDSLWEPRQQASYTAKFVSIQRFAAGQFLQPLDGKVDRGPLAYTDPLPNREMLSKSFLNYSLRDNFVLAYIEFWVAPETDLSRLEELCQELPKKSKYFVPYEDPALWVMGMEKDSIHCWAGASAQPLLERW